MKFLALTLFTIGALLTSAPAQDFTETVKAVLSQTAATKSLAVQGSDKGWLFLRKELEHLAVGDLAAADLSKANVEGTDPLPVIQKYNDELKALGVQLLVVPVPPKAMIYPEKLSDKIDPKTVPSMAAFYAKLKAAGVEVLDLETVFKAERAQHPDRQLYCATDTHWSPYACQLTAKLVAEKYKTLPELSATAHLNLTTSKEETLEFMGDLASSMPGSVAKEKLPFWRAGESSGAEVKTVESDPNSAVLAMGDSHLQVFRKGGDMLATQGGFIDHLQVDLGSAVEEITMQAGGGDGPRLEIARATATRNPDFWAKKKVAVWVFTAREFTQGKWRVLPAKVIKK